MKKILSAIGLGLVAISLLVGCNESREEIDARNRQHFSNPLFAGEVNGKKLFFVIVELPNQYPHFVYFFEGAEEKSVSVNHNVTAGKISYNSVQVLLNGNEVSSFVVTNR